MAPAGSQGQLPSFDVNGLWKPMQSILAHMLISCQGVPDAISIPFYFFWTSLVQKQYILWKNGCVKKHSLTNFFSGYLSVIYHSDTNHVFNDIHGTIVYKDQNQAVDAARLIYIGTVNFSSYRETAEDRLD